MKNAELNRQIAAIRVLIKKSSAATTADMELQAHWARYVCVLSAGLLQNAIVILYSNFIGRNAQKPVAEFATAQVATVQNPKTKRFLEVAGAFKKTWATDLEKFTELNGRKEAIDAIMANRHLIAHGKSSGITIAMVSDYLNKAEQVLEFIEKQLI